MKETHHTEASIATRMKWIADFRAKYPNQKPISLFASIEGFEGLLDHAYDLSDMSRKEIIDLVIQCRVVGLNSKANDYESCLGDLSEKEMEKIYSTIIK